MALSLADDVRGLFYAAQGLTCGQIRPTAPCEMGVPAGDVDIIEHLKPRQIVNVVFRGGDAQP